MFSPRGGGEVMCECAGLREHIKKLERRIHNQRRALRENWEIIEMRASYPRRIWLLPRHLAAALRYKRELEEARAELARAVK